MKDKDVKIRELTLEVEHYKKLAEMRKEDREFWKSEAMHWMAMCEYWERVYEKKEAGR